MNISPRTYVLLSEIEYRMQTGETIHFSEIVAANNNYGRKGA